MGENEITWNENEEASCTCGSNRLAVFRKKSVVNGRWFAVLVCEDCFSNGAVN